MPRVAIAANQLAGFRRREFDRLAEILAARSARRTARLPTCLCRRKHLMHPPDPPVPAGLSEACSLVLLARASGDERAEAEASRRLLALIAVPR